MVGSYADHFAIDYSNGNVFYTSVPYTTTNTTTFAGIGVLSLNGTHKKLISTGKKPRGTVVDPKEG